MFGKEAFTEGLKELGYIPEDLGANRVGFKYKIGAGRFKDSEVMIGIEVPPDFSITCPTGPHIKPRLIPINTNGAANDRAAESPFGADWEYLSRPFADPQQAGWGRTKRTVKSYLWHVKRVLETL
jgi:hypothetical protein